MTSEITKRLKGEFVLPATAKYLKGFARPPILKRALRLSIATPATSAKSKKTITHSMTRALNRRSTPDR